MKRRDFLKLTSYGGIGLASAVWSKRVLGTTAHPEFSHLTTFNFATIQVDRAGVEQKRIYSQAQLHTENLDNQQILAMVLVRGDKFIMGAPLQEKHSSDRERPLHQVRVPTFFLGKYPITQAQWRTVAKFPRANRELDPNPSHFQGDSRPVESISWLDAVEFCDRLSAHTGKLYRLPSEAEWEYACRGKTKTPFAYGATLTHHLADYASTYTYAAETGFPYRQQTTDAGSFLANSLGVYDLHGNVREWCADAWHENYRGAPTNGQAWLKGGKREWRVLRGGSWANKPSHCRSAHRSGYPADSLNRAIGFRVAMSL